MLDKSVLKGLLVLLDRQGPKALAAQLVAKARPDQWDRLALLGQAVHLAVLECKARQALADPRARPAPLDPPEFRALHAPPGTP